MHQTPITAVTCSEYWGVTVSGGADGMINAWSSEDGSQLWSFSQCVHVCGPFLGPRLPHAAQLSPRSLWTPIIGLFPDRRREYVVGQTSDGMFVCWDLQSGRPAWHVPPRNPTRYTLITATWMYPAQVR